MNWQLVCRQAQRYRWNKYGKQSKKKQFNNEKDDISLIIVMLIQTSLFCATILWGGTIKKLNDNSFDILNERVINRKNYIQNEMLQRWSNTSETEATINSSVKKILNEKNALIEDVGNNEEINKDIIKSISNDLIYLLRKTLLQELL